ncbi:MAG: ubiquinol-cytochrome c reductase iron-sulfur subunit [Pseudomonadota bacterium]
MSDDRKVNNQRRNFLITGTSIVGAAGAVGVVTPFLGSWQPSEKAKAAGAPVKADISKLQPGEQMVVEWRGKPVFISRRTQEQLAALEGETAKVADPDSALSVSKKEQPSYVKGIERAIEGHEEYLVVVGLCTHLGCSPKSRPEKAPADLGADWVGGFFCPCHGSKFDLSGRVFKGVPAPTNLMVPPYRFESDALIVIGEDSEVA